MLRNKFKPLSRQRGTVLITVMMMVAIAALIVTDITYRQKMDLLRTSALLSRDQAYQYLLSAEEFARFALAEDLKEDNQKGDPIFKDTLDENWASDQQPIPVPGGFVRGKLFDLQGRFNVNSLVGSDSEQQQQRLASLMTALGIPEEPTVTASQLVQRITDWVDANQEPGGFDGQEDLDYLTRDRPFRTPNSTIFDVSELAVIEGMTANELSELAPFLSFLPPETPVNVNTAEQQVLAAIDPSLSSLVEERKIPEGKKGNTPGFSHKDEVSAYLKKSPGGGAPSGTIPTPGSPTGTPGSNPATNNNNLDQILGTIDVKSHYYLLEAEAVINGKVLLMRSVLFRPELDLEAGQTNKDIKVKTILRKLEDPLKRV